MTDIHPIHAHRAALAEKYPRAIVRYPVVTDTGVNRVTRKASRLNLDDAVHRGADKDPSKWFPLQSYDVGVSAGMRTEICLEPLED